MSEVRKIEIRNEIRESLLDVIPSAQVDGIFDLINELVELEINKSHWPMGFLEGLDKDQLLELLRATYLITDPLSQELIKIASLDEIKRKVE